MTPPVQLTPSIIEQETRQIFESFHLNPYDHQLSCLQDLLADLQTPLPRSNYLMQHATGSGKSMTIGCLAHFLYHLETPAGPRFDKVIIINDRIHLDTQLFTAVRAIFSIADSITVGRVRNATELNERLRDPNCRVFCTTMQKFNFIHADFPSDMNIALISDEAHRSHGASSTRKLHQLLCGEQRQNRHITYFSFTATPTPKCLRLFGSHKDGLIRPFHCFSLADAEAKGLVLNVLKNYSVVPKTFQLKDTVDSDEAIGNGYSVARGLSVEIRSNDTLIRQRAEFVVRHFTDILSRVANPEFKGIAMIVCRTRKLVLKYTHHLRQVLQERKSEFGVFGAFSETDIDGVVECEKKLNVMYSAYSDSKHIARLLADEEKNIRFIVAADKLQTGFDEPRLLAMYVDKVVAGAHAVQTLGRLDRICPGKDEVFVVDFTNQTDAIRRAWSSFYHEAILFESDSDARRLEVFAAVRDRLRALAGVREQDFAAALASVEEENHERQLRLLSPVQTDMLLFMKLVDYFQDDHDSDVKYAFISRLYASLARQSSLKTASLTQLLKSSIEVTPSEQPDVFQSISSPVKSFASHAPMSNSISVYHRRCREMSAKEVVCLAEKMVDGYPPEDSLSDFSNKLYAKNNRDILREIVSKYSHTAPRKRSDSASLNALSTQNISLLLNSQRVQGTLRFLLKDALLRSSLDSFVREGGVPFLFKLCRELSPAEASFGQAALQVILDCLRPALSTLVADSMFDVSYLIMVVCSNTKFMTAPALKILVRLCSLFPSLKPLVVGSQQLTQSLGQLRSTNCCFVKQALESFERLRLVA